MPLYTKRVKKRRLEKMAKRLSKGDGRSTKHHRTNWAYLLKRVFDVDGYACPYCGEGMILRAVFVRSPLSMTLPDAMNWRSPPFGIGGNNGLVFLIHPPPSAPHLRLAKTDIDT